MNRTRMLIVLLIVLSLLPAAAAPAVTAQDDGVKIVGVASAQEPVEAWLTAFGAAHGVLDYTAEFYPAEEEVMSHAAGADLVFYQNLEADLPVEFECGTISRLYVPLPDLGARYLASEDCGDFVSPTTPLLVDFLSFIVGPDGQQVAIDLGLLPAVVEVTDQAGQTVQVPQPVRRIVSAYGVGTYYVYGVGAGDQLVAAAYLGVRSPETVDAMRRIDPDYDTITGAVSVIGQRETNIEEVAALEPDLIISSARASWLETAAELGIPIVRYQGETMDLFREAMTLTGAVLGPNAAYRAAQYVAYYDRVLADVLAQTEGIEPRTRVYFSGSSPLTIASGEMYQTFMIEAAGGDPVGKDLAGFWPEVNLEQVAVWSPEVIFVPGYGEVTAESFTGAEEWTVVQAVQDGRVYRLPGLAGPWDTPAPDSILGIIWMAETLYPDAVTLDCPTEVQHVYGMFYDYAMPLEEAQGLCG